MKPQLVINISHYSLPSTEERCPVTALFTDKNGRLWVEVEDGRTMCLENKTIDTMTIKKRIEFTKE